MRYLKCSSAQSSSPYLWRNVIACIYFILVALLMFIARESLKPNLGCLPEYFPIKPIIQQPGILLPYRCVPLEDHLAKLNVFRQMVV